MKTRFYITAIINELSQIQDNLSDEQTEKLVDSVASARRIFVAGAGRSGLMMRAFAMRMMHLGLDVYVVGETVTRTLEQGDLLIIGSGSGETKSLISMADKARSLGADVVALTIFPKSTIGQLASAIVQLPGTPKDKAEDDERSIQPMGSLFEQTLLLVCDAVILRLMEKQDLTGANMYGNHANLE